MNDDNLAFDELINGGLRTFLRWLENELDNFLDSSITLDNKLTYHVESHIGEPFGVQHYHQIILIASLSLNSRYDLKTRQYDSKADDNIYIGFIEVRNLGDNRLQVVGSCDEISFVSYFYLIENQIIKIWGTSMSSNEYIDEKEEDTEEPNLFLKDKNDIKQSVEQIKEHPPSHYLPKKPVTLAKWKQAYDIIVDRREEHREEFLNNISGKRSLTYKDYQDAIAYDMDWTRSAKTIRKIIIVGDSCLLK